MLFILLPIPILLCCYQIYLRYYTYTSLLFILPPLLCLYLFALYSVTYSSTSVLLPNLSPLLYLYLLLFILPPLLYLYLFALYSATYSYTSLLLPNLSPLLYPYLFIVLAIPLPIPIPLCSQIYLRHCTYKLTSPSLHGIMCSITITPTILLTNKEMYTLYRLTMCCCLTTMGGSFVATSFVIALFSSS